MELQLGLPTLEGLTTKHKILMREEQTRYLKNLLGSAEADCANAPQPDIQYHDPWAALPSLPLQPPSGSDVSRYLVINYASNHYPMDKGVTVNVPATPIVSVSPTVPKYKSIVRLGPNALSANDKTMRYAPYFLEEEQGLSKDDLYWELQDRFDRMPQDLPSRQLCAEKAAFWRETVEDFMREIGLTTNDVMYYLLLPEHQLKRQQPPNIEQSVIEDYLRRDTQCEHCSIIFRRGHWKQVYPRLEQPKGIQLAVAALLCRALSNRTNFSLWHIVSKSAEMQRLLHETRLMHGLQTDRPGNPSDLRCAVCYLHDCPGHGTFLEDDDGRDEEGARLNSESDTEDEAGHNIRGMVNTARSTGMAKNQPKPLCGAYCCNEKFSLRDLLGLDKDGKVTRSPKLNDQCREITELDTFPDDTVCGENCFWTKHSRPDSTVASILNRRDRFLNWTLADIQVYQSLLETFGKGTRGACVIAQACSVSCKAIWLELLVDTAAHHKPHPTVEPPSKPPQSRDTSWFLDHTITHLHDDRAPFVPCSHDGPCEGNVNCSCSKENISCEPFCKCPPECTRRFRGCKCKASAKACFRDERCSCWVLNRECDPHLCGCGVLEVLDPANRYDDSICRGRCKNAGLQRDVPKNTWKGPSEVQGWGLFAAEDIKASEFVGEYKGEIISTGESDRRGAVYHHRGVEYLFRLNKDQEVDSTRAGNKMRFINNSQLKKNINCFAHKSFVNGVQRIGLYAKRDIKAGEEMFFNYGYPDSVTKHFWEKGEQGPGSGKHLSDDSDSDEDVEIPRSKGKGKLIAVKEHRNGVKARKKKGLAIPLPSRVKTNKKGTASRKRGFDHLINELSQYSQSEGASDRPASTSLGSSFNHPDPEAEIAESSDEVFYSGDESIHSSSDASSSEDDDADVEDEIENLNLSPSSASDSSSSTSHPKPSSSRTRGPKISSLNPGPGPSGSRPGKRRHIKRSLSEKYRRPKGKAREPVDTRYGGAAQKLGWITRKENMERSRKMKNLDRKRKRRREGRGRGKERA